MAKSISLKKNEKYTFEIQSNPTTGYLWSAESYDETMVRVTLENRQKKKSIDDVIIGASILVLVTIEALSAGETTVVLVEKRPWEKDKKPIKKIELQILVIE